MKKIAEALNSLTIDNIKQLKEIFQIKVSSSEEILKNNIMSSIQSLSGINKLLKSLNTYELKIIKSAIRNENGVTFGELEKYLNTGIEAVENYSTNLSSKLLVYIYKNRQKLNNKLDRLYIIDGIKFLNPLDETTLNQYFSELYEYLIKEKNNDLSIKESYKKILNYIFTNGCIVTLNEIYNILNINETDDILNDMAAKKYIYIFHDLDVTGNTFIIIDKKVAANLLNELSSTTKTKTNINNYYYFLINILKTFDTVSSYGLFITKQNSFRKIDIGKISEAMLPLYNYNGQRFNNEDIWQLSLFILNLMNAAQISNDSVNISLNNISDDLENPLELTSKIIKVLRESYQHQLFKASLALPSHNTILYIIELLSDYNFVNLDFIEIIYKIKLFSKIINQTEDIDITRKELSEELKNGLQLLILLGIIRINDGLITLSDIGKDAAVKLNVTDNELSDTSIALKNIYINNDLTIIVPKEEMSSEDLYHILSHTDIIKDDIILNARICRESVLTANKRGMNNTTFLNILTKHSKNEIPKNLNFLIDEWEQQTIKIEINNALLLKANQASFIDEIAHSAIKSCIIERLSPNHIIIDKAYLEKITKLAKKYNAIISLFNERERD